MNERRDPIAQCIPEVFEHRVPKTTIFESIRHAEARAVDRAPDVFGEKGPEAVKRNIERIRNDSAMKELMVRTGFPSADSNMTLSQIGNVYAFIDAADAALSARCTSSDERSKIIFTGISDIVREVVTDFVRALDESRQQELIAHVNPAEKSDEFWDELQQDDPEADGEFRTIANAALSEWFEASANSVADNTGYAGNPLSTELQYVVAEICSRVENELFGDDLN